MGNSSAALPARTVGLDLGDQQSAVYAVDESGRAVQQGAVATTRPELTAYFGRGPRCRVVMEAGTHSPWVSRALVELGHEVVVANPTELYGSRRRKKRNDRLDAEFLARQGRADVQLLHPIQHRGPTAQLHLAVVRARDQLVRARTQLINHVRGAVKSTGGRLRRGSTAAFARTAGSQLEAGLLPALAPVLTMIEALTTQIAGYDHAIAAVVATQYPDAGRLQQVPGVGPLTALAFVLLVDDPHRFSRSRDVGAYFGLVPRLDASGGAQPQLRISKAGDELGRRLLVTAAHYILGPFGPASDLRRHGEAIARRGGANGKKRAVVAVARKLAVLLHRLWVTGAPYRPDRQPIDPAAGQAT